MKVLKIVKKADDVTLGKKVLRVSIGGTDEDGAYIVYRGDLADVQDLLREVARMFMLLTEEMPVSSDDGKAYA